MFEDLDVVTARLLATAPAQDDPCGPTLDPAGTLPDELVEPARVIAAAQAQTMVIQAAPSSPLRRPSVDHGRMVVCGLGSPSAAGCVV